MPAGNGKYSVFCFMQSTVLFFSGKPATSIPGGCLPARKRSQHQFFAM
jgi:hypothetical protein